MRKAILGAFFFCVLGSAFAAERGLQVAIANQEGVAVRLYNESHALIIGASRYTNGWPSLPGVRDDVEAVSSALKLHGFQVTVVNDPSRGQLIKAFESFINRHGLNPENRLLFYFAGHGHTIRLSYGEEMGYIVPVDAPNPNLDKDRFLSTALDMQMIEVFAKRIQSKHALFLFDSCFSGAIFSLSRAVPEAISYKASKPVRQFITAGAADEQVPDKSVFRQQFVSALLGETAIGKDDGFITGSALGDFLQSSVVNYSRGSQHPQYGKIRNPNLDKGDFVFQIPTAATRPPKAFTLQSDPNPTVSSEFPAKPAAQITLAYASPERAYPDLVFNQRANRFRQNSDGTIFDDLLNKRWRPLGDEIFSRHDAITRLGRLDGHWRLPTKEELQSLLVREKAATSDWGYIHPVFPQNQRTSKFWTSSAEFFGGNWYVDFALGRVSKESDQNYNAVFAISD